MSAVRLLLSGVKREGAAFRLEGRRLRLVPSPGRALPRGLVERAKAMRAELLAELSSSPDTPEDWRAWFDERAGILEFDADLPRANAEARAYEAVLVHWLDHNSAHFPTNMCAH